jgi:predicted PurR-regulated permease PerM
VADGSTTRKPPLSDLAPDWLRFLGINGWLVIGVTGAVVAVAWFFSAIASVAIPLAFAVMLGVVFAPLVDYLQRLRVPRVVGAVVGLLLVVLLVGGAAWITVSSVITQWPMIQKQLTSAWAQLGQLAAHARVPTSLLNEINAAVKNALPTVAQGAASVVTTGLSSTFSLLFGIFLALYMLYLVLADYHKLSEWMGGHVGLPVAVGSGIVDDTASSLRAYFRGSTIIGIANALVIAIGMWILHVPLIFPVAVVTVILGYIPFFGALISGVFAVFIALGANGLQTALILLVVVLFAQNVVQMPIQSAVMGDALELHPIAVLVTTMIGGIFGGLLGGMLGAPVTAVAVRSITRIRAAAAEESSPPGVEPAEVPASV